MAPKRSGGGGLRAASRCRDPSRGAGKHAENREQAPQPAHTDQAVGAPYHLFFQDRVHARSRYWAVYQSLRVWMAHLTWNQHLCDTFAHSYERVPPVITTL